VRTSVGFDADESLVGERAQRRPDRVAGNGVIRGDVLLTERGPWLELAVEDPHPERVRQSVHGGRAL
jgi:hypothetical protein